MELGAERDSVNVQFFRSNPYDFTSPAMAVGVGRLYASAALYPGVLVNSGFLRDGSDDMDGDERSSFRVVGETDAIEDGGSLSSGCVCSSRESLDEFGNGEDEHGEGNGMSSTEKIDRSSPFH